jgi:hypothetical protein
MLEVKLLSIKYNLPDLFSFKHPAPFKLKSEGLIGCILFWWSHLTVTSIVDEDLKESKAISYNKSNDPNSLVPFKDVSVKMLYNLFLLPKHKEILVPKRNLEPINNWQDRWYFLHSIQYLSPTDKQFIHKVWNIKLWTFDFRAAATELICPLCLEHEDYFNHPIELCCSFTEVLFNSFNQLWYKWTSNQILDS